MKMLRLFLIIALVLYASTPVFAELSVEDLEKIRQIVNETEVRLGKRIEAVEGRLDKRITDLRDRINFQGHLIIALIVAILTFVAVPMGIIVYQYNRNRDRQEAEIKALRDQEAEIQILRRRIEELERKPIIQA
ncbi:hypothetical protein F4X88_12895 [Candidatus Poribacteria bacterium]|nr:hypothetical protein [Candidatus Poribacteria bacterium]MXV85821.1 hypothetical protein [Candidatus Poribacteria bacterium]MYA57188.1 hypothetical protein [Candidatus Poribacteria bacterium]